MKVHVNHILAKLGVAGRVEATMVAVQRGMVRLMGNRQAERPVDRGEGGGRRHIAFGELKSERQVQPPPASNLYSLSGNPRNERNSQIQSHAHLPAR